MDTSQSTLISFLYQHQCIKSTRAEHILQSSHRLYYHSVLPSCSDRIAVFVYRSVASREHLSVKRKSLSELWTTKTERRKKTNCPQPVRSSRSDPRIVPGVNLKALRTGAGCKQPQHAWLTGLPVSHGCMNTLTRRQQTGTQCDGRYKARK